MSIKSLQPASPAPARPLVPSSLRLRRQLPQLICCQQRTYAANKSKSSSKTTTTTTTTKGIGVQWAPKILLDPLFQNESERRRRRRLARTSLLLAQPQHKKDLYMQMNREVPLNDILEWIQETAPELPDLQERRALTDPMGNMLRKSGWKIHSSQSGYNQLVRQFKFRGFQDSFVFLARLSQVVTLSDHFPEIEWDKHHIWVKLKTFGMPKLNEDPSAVYFVSKSDVDMAKLINSLVDEISANDQQILPDILPTAAKRVGRNLYRDIDKIVQSKDDCKLEELVHQVLSLQVS
ncbi:hypothetical protein V1525DRAFT_397023 [Lipomyces kononenkoae]|uniref:Uncharacterized protein n=1 Tax=Lipomyces kononenkoae TaxID=34357 RepID=A0ACC3T7E7_LIPKO